jgi:hypothetical protein
MVEFRGNPPLTHRTLPHTPCICLIMHSINNGHSYTLPHVCCLPSVNTSTLSHSNIQVSSHCPYQPRTVHPSRTPCRMILRHIYIPVLIGHNHSTFKPSKVTCRTLLQPPPGATTTLTFQMTCLKNQSNSHANSLPLIDAQHHARSHPILLRTFTHPLSCSYPKITHS